jgi:hypothetical protein
MRPVNKEKQFIKILNFCNKKNGECLSESYINIKTKLKFQCKNNHIFYMDPSSIFDKRWCRECSGIAKLDINKINNQYISKNVKCISTIYIDNKHILKWQCLKCNFNFKQSKNGMDKDFIRCKKCFQISQLIKAKEHAEKRGGICLSKKYNGSLSKLKFKCKNKHIFYMVYYCAIDNKHWCPKCSRTNNISEEICRAYFEQMFGEKFINVRPNWLKKSNGYNLELDGYCEKLNLAFEHNGTFHYKNKKRDNSACIKNDKLKLKMCKKYNVYLIVIKHLFNNTPLNKLRNIIINFCKDNKIYIPYPNININLSNCYDKKSFDVYLNIAKSKGGKCLSDYCGAANQKLKWKCKFGHVWEQFPYVIKKGSWCPHCANKNRGKYKRK